MENKYQVKIIDLTEECLEYKYVDYRNLDDRLTKLLESKNPNNGDIVMFDQFRMSEGYVYMNGELIDSRDECYIDISYDIAMSVPGSAYEQYKHEDVNEGDCIVSLTLTHKDKLWEILDLDKYTDSFRFSIYGIFYDSNENLRIETRNPNLRMNDKENSSVDKYIENKYDNFIDIRIPHVNSKPDWDKLKDIIGEILK